LHKDVKKNLRPALKCRARKPRGKVLLHVTSANTFPFTL